MVDSPIRLWKTSSEVCYSAIKELPDVSVEQEARDYLVIAQERYEKLIATSNR